MAYTMTTTIRLVNVDGAPVVKKPFVAEVRVEPCAPSERRYVVKHPAGEVEHPWWQVILEEDNARVRFLKYREAKATKCAREMRDELDRQIRRGFWGQLPACECGLHAPGTAGKRVSQ